jgi:hypothetical protein
MSVRDEIRELCIAHDKQMAEDREWLARREAQARPFVRKSDNPAGLIFKTVENASAPAPQPDAAASFSHDDETLYALNEFSKAVVERFREIDRENIALKAKLDVVLALVGEKQSSREKKSLSDVVVDLPQGFWKRDVA